MDWNWDEIINWDWSAIDEYLYQDNMTLAGNLVREKYESIYGRLFRINASHTVTYERFRFLARYYPDRFLPTKYWLLVSGAIKFPIQIDTKKNNVIRLHAEWNVEPPADEPVVKLYSEADWEPSRKNSGDQLVGFVEYIEKEASDKNERLHFDDEITRVYQELPTVFDPDFPPPPHEQMLQDMKLQLQEIAMQLGVPYFLPSRLPQPAPTDVDSD